MRHRVPQPDTGQYSAALSDDAQGSYAEGSHEVRSGIVEMPQPWGVDLHA